MSAAKSFEDLDAYRHCRGFRLHATRRIALGLVQKKKFLLADQLKRSARSITANLAEGFGRYHSRDNDEYCSIARGSLRETFEHIICAVDEGPTDQSALDKARELFHPAANVLNGYMAYLARAAKAGDTKAK